MSTSSQEEKENLRKNSECQILGKGGDELKLALLSSLDESAYSQWVETIKDNPSVIELDVIGIWTLLQDEEKAKALQEAYEAGTIFRQISSLFGVGRKVYILRGDQFFYYDLDTRTSAKPRSVASEWPSLAKHGFDRNDAAFSGEGLRSDTNEDLSRKVFMFQGSRYLRFDIDTSEIDAGYPKEIKDGWPGIPFNRIDAALNCDGQDVYFFVGNQYVRYNIAENRVDDGYPDLVSNRWLGVSFDRIDAAIHWYNGKVYFFREDQYIRYDMITYQADPGYPKYVIGQYVEDWNFFD